MATTGNARGRASRARLLEAAASCFGVRGYQATRIADIAEEAGMSAAGFYRHFPDKQTILLETLETPLAQLLDTLAELPSTIDADEITEHHVAFFTVYAEHRRVLRVLRELALTHDEALEEVWLQTRQGYVGRIAKWLRRLGIRKDVDVLADALGDVLDQLAYTRVGLARKDPAPKDVQKLGEVSGTIWTGTLERLT